MLIVSKLIAQSEENIDISERLKRLLDNQMRFSESELIGVVDMLFNEARNEQATDREFAELGKLLCNPLLGVFKDDGLTEFKRLLEKRCQAEFVLLSISSQEDSKLR